MTFEPTSEEQAAQAITRLVDGTLSSAERESIQAWADSSPEITRQVLAQRRVAQDLAHGGPAPPERLVASIERRVGATDRRARVEGPRRSPRRSNWLAGIAAGGLATAVAIAVAAGGSSAAPSVDAAAKLAFVPAAAPAPSATSARYLDVSYGGVTFPNYATLHARPSGELTNRIGGRPALTVYYRLANGSRLSYTVFSGKPVPRPAAARLVRYAGVPLYVYRLPDGLSVVTLVRSGRTCVLAARTGEDVVLGLAAAPVLTDQA